MDLERSELAKLIGRTSGAIRALDAVSKSDVRHWCELIGDADPAYREKIKTGEKAVPPAMLMAWAMDPLWPPRGEAREPHEKAAQVLGEAGYSGAVGIALEQEFFRSVQLGDRLSFTVEVVGLSSAEEETKLGKGYLLRLLYTFLNEKGEKVSTQNYTVLGYRTLDPQLS